MTITILCVDDSSDDTLLLRRACRRAGVKFVLQSVDDGDKAIAYLSGMENYSDRTAYPIPTLLLLDLKMPTKTGFEVLEWLRKQPAYGNLPVAVLTSSHHESDIRDAYLKGANCFLTKPVDYSQLVELVKALDQSFENQQAVPDRLRQLALFKPPPGSDTGL